mmetsp:Transcript_5105/g.14557  ORF Transcript_5105/g.14557 Transcript_5105/m.14557 type:complete len:248 (-) Transcript_5105:722-1465(-)
MQAPLDGHSDRNVQRLPGAQPLPGVHVEHADEELPLVLRELVEARVLPDVEVLPDVLPDMLAPVREHVVHPQHDVLGEVRRRQALHGVVAEPHLRVDQRRAPDMDRRAGWSAVHHLRRGQHRRCREGAGLLREVLLQRPTRQPLVVVSAEDTTSAQPTDEGPAVFQRDVLRRQGAVHDPGLVQSDDTAQYVDEQREALAQAQTRHALGRPQAGRRHELLRHTGPTHLVSRKQLLQGHVKALREYASA